MKKSARKMTFCLALTASAFIGFAACGTTPSLSPNGAPGAAAPDRSTASANASSASTEPYSISYQAGGSDANGRFLGGTEFMSLVAFQGKLYGGIGYWEDDPNSSFPHPGAQVLVLDSRGGQWREEAHFNDGMNRVGMMGVVTFHNDKNGQPLAHPVELLIAGTDSAIAGGAGGQRAGSVHVQIAPGQWKDAAYPSNQPLRSMTMYKDPSTGKEMLYVGSAYNNTAGAVYAAVYDPADPHAVAGLSWIQTPAAQGFNNRVMSMTECDGKAFFSAKPKIFSIAPAAGMSELCTQTGPDSSDAPLPNGGRTWGFRGLTCLQDQALLGAFEGAHGNIVQVDVKNGKMTTELVARDFLTSIWRAPPANPVGVGQTKDLILAYNNMPSVQVDGVGYHLISTNAHSPDPERHINSTWFMSRQDSAHGSYQLHEVPALPFNASYGRKDRNRKEDRLYAIRTIAVSPFPEDGGEVLYIAGYDAHVDLGVHNTAWAYRVGVRTALQPFH